MNCLITFDTQLRTTLRARINNGTVETYGWSVTTDTSTTVDGCRKGQKELHNREDKQTRTQASYICCCLSIHVILPVAVVIAWEVIWGIIATRISSLAVSEFGILRQGHSIADEHGSSNDTSKDRETHKTSNLITESRKYTWLMPKIWLLKPIDENKYVEYCDKL